jgi:hypothetical protein
MAIDTATNAKWYSNNAEANLMIDISRTRMEKEISDTAKSKIMNSHLCFEVFLAILASPVITFDDC